jgi:hypothetical protein
MGVNRAPRHPDSAILGFQKFLGRGPRGGVARQFVFTVAPVEKRLLHPDHDQDVLTRTVLDHLLQPAAHKIFQIQSQPPVSNATFMGNFTDGLLLSANVQERGGSLPQRGEK